MRRTRSTDSPAQQHAAILKAAVEEIELVGLGRANLDVVARSAGVSRSTLYRRFPNRDALLTAVGRWTFETAMQGLSTITVGAEPQDAAVAAFVEGLRLLTTMPVLREFLQFDAGAIVVRTGTAGDVGDVLAIAARALADGLRSAGAQMPAEELLAVAELHIRLACSVAQVPTAVLDVDDPDAVRAYARRHLAPLVR